MKVGDLVYLKGSGYRIVANLHGKWVSLLGDPPQTIWPHELLKIINKHTGRVA